MIILTGVKAEVFTKTEKTQGISIRPMYKELTDVPYGNFRLIKVDKKTGEMLVHVANQGILLEWNRIESLGTVYPVSVNDLVYILETLNNVDNTCNYYFI